MGLPGLRDRAPLRPRLLGSHEVRDRVFPVFVTGLHCGHTAFVTAVIPAEVFPVFVTGLHCGSTSPVTRVPRKSVFPVFVTGLHCGSTSPVTRVPRKSVFPVFVTGLHCGPSWVRALVAAAYSSSRSS